MSVPSALITAIGWLKEERVDKVLFGAVDEYCDVLGHCWYRFYGHSERIAMDPFLFHEQTAILGEGAAFFLLSLNREAGAPYGGILEVKMEYTEKIDYFHSNQDLLILGADGHKVWGHRYAHLGKENTKMVAYTPLYGSFPTNMALDMTAALTCIKAQKLFAQPTGSSYPPSINIIREEHVFVEGKIHCLKLASNGGTGTILIAKD
jgi:3-oxoacyl-[acyl-carrier-protein] synthase II